MTQASPKYKLIKNNILDQIREGKLSSGSQIPSINDLMGKFHVSKVTAVRALAELESEGVVRREHGRGTFVTSEDAAALQARTSRRVALLVPDMVNPFNIEVVGSLERSLRESGVVVELNCTDYRQQTERELFRTLAASNHLAGLVLISAGVDEMGVSPSQVRVPLVAIDHCPRDLMNSAVFINCDHFKGGYEAALHLASFGHRDIGYIDWHIASRARLEGFRRGLHDYNIELPQHRILAVGRSNHIGPELLDFVRRDHLTALFAVNDMLAMQAMQFLRSYGYAIPNDISLMGHDDVMAARYLEVPLTSVEQHEEQIGRKAAESLLERLDARQSGFRPKEILIVPRVVQRASTGPPRNAAVSGAGL